MKPKLIPLEYCTIERAARMLEIEVDDIKHFNEANYIPLHIKSFEKVEGEEWNEKDYCYISVFVTTHTFKSYCSGSHAYKDHEIYIMQEGLQVIFAAIYENIPLKKIQVELPDKLIEALNQHKSLQTLSIEQKNAVKDTVFRLSNPQKEFMSALICLLPELKEEIESNTSKSTDVMSDWLGKAKLPEIELGENNYKRWVMESDYSRNLTIRKNIPNILTSK
jgi:hypothetical protein